MQPNLLQIAAVAVGGMLGSVLRLLTSVFVNQGVTGNFPWATFFINISGSLLIGIVFGVFGKFDNEQGWLSNENWRFLLATGFCGGFTTFSAFSHEGYLLIKQQQYTLFFVYFTASVVAGVLATATGYLITR